MGKIGGCSNYKTKGNLHTDHNSFITDIVLNCWRVIRCRHEIVNYSSPYLLYCVYIQHMANYFAAIFQDPTISHCHLPSDVTKSLLFLPKLASLSSRKVNSQSLTVLDKIDIFINTMVCWLEGVAFKSQWVPLIISRPNSCAHYSPRAFRDWHLEWLRDFQINENVRGEN